MKKTFLQFLLLLALVATLPQAQAQMVEGNGIYKTENRSVSSFTGVSVSGGFEVELTQGNTESVKLEAEENVLPLIETKVEDGTLYIKMKSGLRRANRLKAFVTVRDLKQLHLSGGIKLKSTNTINSAALDLEFSGGINAVMALQVKELSCEFAGGTKVTLSGRADKVKAEMAGASNLKALDLKTEYFSIESAGANNAQINVSKELSVDAAGVANIDYKGSPKVNHSGMGKVRPI